MMKPKSCCQPSILKNTSWSSVISISSGIKNTRATIGLTSKKAADGKRPSGLFAPGVMVGKTLYIAGKGDYKPNEDFPVKVKNCLGEIEKTLKQAGLVRARHEGRQTHYSAQLGALAPLIDWTSQMAGFWQSRFDHLEDLLKRMDQ